MLRPALDALDAGRDDDALAALLDAWRTHRDVRLGDAIEAVGARIARGRVRPTGKTVAAKRLAWLELEAKHDPADLDLLLATLIEIKKAEALAERLARLAERPPDPRIARALMVHIASPPIAGASGIEPLRAMLELVVTTRDERATDALRALAGTIANDAYHMAVQWRFANLARFVARIAPSQVAAIAGLAGLDELDARMAPAPTHDLAALFAAVYDAPTDLAPRTVLADALQAIDDPRGEFIALQLARAPGSRPTKRESELARIHQRTWLGPIEPAVQKAGVRFDGGFLAKCSLRSAADRERLATRPEWRTVRELDATGWPYPAPLIDGLPILRTLIVHGPYSHPTIESLTIAGYMSSAEVARVYALRAPRLRTLAITNSGIREFDFAHPLVEQLATLELDGAGLDGWIAQVRNLPAALRDRLELAISTHRDDPWRLRFARGTVTAEYLWRGTPDDSDRLAAALTLVDPAHYPRAAIPADLAITAPLRAALDRFAQWSNEQR